MSLEPRVPAPQVQQRSLLASFTAGEVRLWRWAEGCGGPRRAPRCCRIYLSLPALLQQAPQGTGGRLETIRLGREGFEAVLHQAVHDDFEPSIYRCRQSWRLATRFAGVLIRWIPDVDLEGRSLPRQTPLLSLRSPAMRQLSERWGAVVEGWPGGGVPAVRPYPVPDPLLDHISGRSA